MARQGKTEAEGKEEIREIAALLGLAISSSMRYARQQATPANARKVEDAWKKLADAVIVFALDEDEES